MSSNQTPGDPGRRRSTFARCACRVRAAKCWGDLGRRLAVSCLLQSYCNGANLAAYSFGVIGLLQSHLLSNQSSACTPHWRRMLRLLKVLTAWEERRWFHSCVCDLGHCVHSSTVHIAATLSLILTCPPPPVQVFQPLSIQTAPGTRCHHPRCHHPRCHYPCRRAGLTVARTWLHTTTTEPNQHPAPSYYCAVSFTFKTSLCVLLTLVRRQHRGILQLQWYCRDTPSKPVRVNVNE